MNGATQKQVYKYLEVTFTSDGRHDKKLNIKIIKAIATTRALHYSVVVRRELSEKSKALNF